MDRETSSNVYSILKAVHDAKMPEQQKLMILREVLKATFPPESSLVKQLDADQGAASFRMDDFFHVAVSVLPIYTDRDSSLPNATPVASASDELSNRIGTEVRLSLNEKFMSSWIFRSCAAALCLAATLFTFGLFTLSTEVKRADALVDDFHNKLAGVDKRLAEQEDSLKDRLRQANNAMSDQIDKAQFATREAQKDSMTLLNKNLADRVSEVEGSKNRSIEQINQKVRDVEDTRSNTVAQMNQFVAHGKSEIEGVGNTAKSELQLVQSNEEKLLREKAQVVINALASPTMRSLLNRSYYYMWAAIVLSFLSLVIAALALIRAR